MSVAVSTSLFLSHEKARERVSPDERLHLKFFTGTKAGPVPAGEGHERPVVFCLHGAIENGRIFYSQSSPQKGLAPYLANQGFDVYVADLRGHGESWPPISERSRYGQWEAICEDLPLFVEALRRRHPGTKKFFWVAHSWGGVLQLAALARNPHWREGIAGMVLFGSKRSVRVWNWERLLKVTFAWNFWGPWKAKRQGFLDAVSAGWGSDQETRAFLEQSVTWVKGGPWVDPVDGFDYERALRGIQLPPILFLAGPRDRALGHPQDVRRLMKEAGALDAQGDYTPGVDYWLLARENGFERDYGHIDMLTHAGAVRDHFPKVVAWLRKQIEVV